MTTPVDTLGMLDLAFALPEQIEDAIEQVADLVGLPEHEDIEQVVVLGMGGSGIAGDVMAAVAGPFMPVPVVVQKGYAPPQFVNDRTLVFAVSCSGETEETVEAATLAALDGARLVVVAQGGRLAKLAAEWGAAFVQVDQAIPMPRAALGALAIPPLLVLDQVGLFPGATGWVDAAVTQLRTRRELVGSQGEALRPLAGRLASTVPVIYGGGSIGDVAARRWKAQCNENAKVPAFANTVPELTHNEICGWGPESGVDRSGFHVVALRTDLEHPQVARRFAYLADLLDGVVHGIDEVRADGEGTLAQLLDLAFVGDLVSVLLAYELGVDPGPIPVLADLKERLAEPGDES